jgi:hypothetical protein
MYLDMLEPALLILGFLVFALSLTLYLKRSRDFKSVVLFWQAQMTLSHKEFVISRVGITIMFMGLALRFFNNW